jgi:hypothetical protein
MHTSHTLIDNIFLDKNRFNSKVYPLINGISDHDAHLAVLFDIICPPSKPPPMYSRVIDDYSVNMVNLLSCQVIKAGKLYFQITILILL